MAKVVKAE